MRPPPPVPVKKRSEGTNVATASSSADADLAEAADVPQGAPEQEGPQNPFELVDKLRQTGVAEDDAWKVIQHATNNAIKRLAFEEIMALYLDFDEFDKAVPPENRSMSGLITYSDQYVGPDKVLEVACPGKKGVYLIDREVWIDFTKEPLPNGTRVKVQHVHDKVVWVTVLEQVEHLEQKGKRITAVANAVREEVRSFQELADDEDEVSAAYALADV